MAATTPGPYIGIDFGTTQSAIAYARTNEDGSSMSAISVPSTDRMPTAVYIDKNGEHFVGYEALKRGAKDPARLYTHFKRDLGKPARSLDGEVIQTDDLAGRVIQRLLEGPKAKGFSNFAPVICHPAGGDWERILTQIMHNLGVRAIPLSEPEAVLYWAHYETYRNKSYTLTEKPQVVLLIDFGGGTCDFLLMKVWTTQWRTITKPQWEFIDDDRLDFAGQDIDRIIRDMLADQWTRDHKNSRHLRDRLDQPGLDCQLMTEARSIKENLSLEYRNGKLTHNENIVIRGLPHNSVLRMGMTPADLRAMTSERIDQGFRHVLLERKEHPGPLLYRKGYRPENVALVLLAGGSNNLPWVKDLILPGIFPSLGRQKKIKILSEPEMAVAYGAALYAYDQDEKLPRLPRFLQENLRLEFADGTTTLLVSHGTAVPLNKDSQTAYHTFDFPKTGRSLLLKLVADSSHRSAESRPLYSEPKLVEFDEVITEGTKMALRTEIDRTGLVHLHIAPAVPAFSLRRHAFRTVFFEPLKIKL